MEQVSQIKLLLDQLAAVVAEMEAMTEVAAPEGDAPAAAMNEEEESSLRSLADRADKLKERIAFHEKVAAKEVEMRAILERGAPAARVKANNEESTVAENRTVYAVPKSHGALRAFRSAESAYRAGMHIKGFTFGDAEARRWCWPPVPRLPGGVDSSSRVEPHWHEQQCGLPVRRLNPSCDVRRTACRLDPHEQRAVH